MQTVTAFPLVHALALDHPEHGIVGGLIPGPGTACACSACLTPARNCAPRCVEAGRRRAQAWTLFRQPICRGLLPNRR